MKKPKAILVTLLLIACLMPVSMMAETSDAAMNAFWEKFKAAVIKGDKEAVFTMSALPINLGYATSKVKTKAQFMKDYKYMFANETDAAKCFKTATPEFDRQRPKEFIVGCPFKGEASSAGDPFVYTFKLTRAGWRFAGFENINE